MFGLKVPSAAASMIRGLLQKVPHERLGGRYDAELIHHPFFECIDFDALERKEIQVKSSQKPLVRILFLIFLTLHNADRKKILSRTIFRLQWRDEFSQNGVLYKLNDL